MGNSESRSHERLGFPLEAQSPPVLATQPGSIVTESTSLCVQRMGSYLQVTDVGTKRHVFDFKSDTLRSRKTLRTPDGRALLSLERKGFSSSYHLYEGDERVEIRVDGFSSTILYVDFRDRLSRRPCRIVLDGNKYDRVAMFYLEYGKPNLPYMPTAMDLEDAHRFYKTRTGRRDAVATRKGKRFQAIGRIRRPYVDAFAPQEYYIEAAQGVDTALLLMLWRAWKDIDDRRG